MEKKYEIEYVCKPGYHWQSEIAMLTGYPVEDVIEVIPERHIWYAKNFINTFKLLGFNHDPRFVKFNPATDKPCLMRFVKAGTKENRWYSAVYYDGHVYAVGYGKMTFERFVKVHITPHYRVTSMLRVWI
jgi:hypothetical protein